ncbi:glycosyltransferase [Microcoleus sp. FACHB-672]|uniref:glycosyltransferase n=1 Tax=Microcoleus sp. FACHB-672 TaxID=2692825 RepID=UPI001687C54D|nr:glycosyltransferase [Microcoleus sp. FACHB-672]MBD2040866.1 glycosyltransferase [Microcoleus sp. FACHB-672]
MNDLQSTEKPLLSLCMIVKNESQNLPRCLASAQPYVDEIIVVDTGSEDNTLEIAARYGAKIGYFNWCDDFSAARNYSLSLVSGDWILVVDADEELVINSESFWVQLSSHPEIFAYSIIRTEANDESMAPLYHVRLFRNLPELSYSGVLHEQLRYNDQPLSAERVSYLENFRMLHYGNTQELTDLKTLNRNLPILERARQEKGLSLMLLYCLAGMYDRTGQREKAHECYAQAFDNLLPHLLNSNPPDDFGFVPSLVFTLAAQCLLQQDYETARLLCQRGLEWCPNYPPINYIAGITLIALGFPLGAVTYFDNCLQMGKEDSYYKGEPFERSFITTDPAFEMGRAYLELGHFQQAIAAFELALSFDASFTDAQQQIENIRQLLSIQA